MIEIRIHGRGGQGVVAASELLAIAFFKDGKKSQAFPNFGVERSGAPIQSFVRVSDKDILSRDHVYNPDILIIQDDSLIGKSNIFSGIKKSTLIIINSKEKLNNLFIKIKKEKDLPKNFSEKNILVVDASKVALEIFKKNIVNTAILGTLAKVPNLLNLKSIFLAVEEKFQDKGREIIEKNILAIEHTYNLK
ncbi:MAG TPA: 2-oxoacid:acceptor oxidoreductase family protein [bacterium]|nr:2-oxoacid:acceptor oxidoreductase family protein [bacterium]HPV65493.1 2-oxoacid:acceptor oxidoreductase family protein [bacterium]